MMVAKEKAILVMKEGITQLKTVASKKGWEEDEMDEKITEVFENFPWYKYEVKKRSWKSWLWNISLYLFIIYLAVGAFFERNKRLRKNVNDFLYDLQIPYQQVRLVRFMSLPFLKYYDLSKFSDRECLIPNPYADKPEIKCEFCEDVKTIISEQMNATEIYDQIADGAPFVLSDVPNYSGSKIGFADVKNLFTKYGDDMDEAICHITGTDQFSKVSDYFKLSEEEVNRGNLSIVWSNCDTYGTRFYRKLFPRPSFISTTSEVYLEKSLFFMQPGLVLPVERLTGESTYFYQVQGESTLKMQVPQECHYDCISQPIEFKLRAGQLLITQNQLWSFSLDNSGKRLSIIYKSSFDI